MSIVNYISTEFKSDCNIHEQTAKVGLSPVQIGRPRTKNLHNDLKIGVIRSTFPIKKIKFKCLLF